MKAIVRHEYGPPDVLELLDIEIPVPLDGEVLVRVHAAGVNMADVDYMLGRPKSARMFTGLKEPRNRALGLDVAGRVQAVGKDVERFEVGDAVFGDLTDHGYGAFAEYVCASENAFAHKPTNLSFTEAATVPQAGVMALQGLGGRGAIRPGQRVLINGAGGNVGPFAVQIAKSLGAEVTGIDRGEKLDMLRSIGADHVIDFTAEDVMLSGNRYDRILDVAAYRSIFEWRKLLVPRGAYVAVANSLSGFFSTAFLGLLIRIVSGRRMGIQTGRVFAKRDVAFLTELIESGDVRPIIDRSYPLDEVPAALRYQNESYPLGKIVIKVRPD